MSLLSTTIAKIGPQNKDARGDAKKRLDQLTMPHWALGRLMDLSLDLAGITGRIDPPVKRRTVITMAADHGVTEESVSKYPKEVTIQMVHNFVAGGAGINALARQAGANIVVVDMGVAGDLSPLSQEGKIVSKRIAAGTANMAKGPAMSDQEAEKCVEAGIEIAASLADTTDVIGVGDMGIGNTTPSAAIVSCITGKNPSEVTGRGTGIDDNSLKNKIGIIEKALSSNCPDRKAGMDVLQKVGGFEIGGIAGVILGAASMRKPVLIDGFISTAGALIANALAPACNGYMIAAHKSVEPGHVAALGYLGKEPLLDLSMRLGEGTGAALAMNIVDAAARILTEVATFEEAAVSTADK